MHQLPNGCSCSSLSVTPKNWQKSTANPKKKWRVVYRFYEPGMPVKQRAIRGMNRMLDLEEKQSLTQEIIDDELNSLRAGYNPNKGKYIREEKNGEISGADTLEFALKFALTKATLDKRTRKTIASNLNSFLRAAKLLHYSTIPVRETRRKHIIAILEKCEIINPKFSDYTFNRYRTDLKILFKELVKREIIETSPIDEFLEPRKRTKKIRLTLTDEERKTVDAYLHEKHFAFWRFMQIFFHSGSRISELLEVKVKDVDLKRQAFLVTVKKGKQRYERIKVIKNIALPWWKDLLLNAVADDYIFSYGFIPGKIYYDSNNVSKHWREKVMHKFGIKATMYSLKHSHTDEVAELLSIKEAAKHNSHTTEAMVLNIYAVGEKERERQRIKGLDNKFA